MVANFSIHRTEKYKKSNSERKARNEKSHQLSRLAQSARLFILQS